MGSPFEIISYSLIFLVIGSISSAKLNMLDLHQYFGVALLGLVFLEYMGIFGHLLFEFQKL